MNWHHGLVARVLDYGAAGEIPRLMLFMPSPIPGQQGAPGANWAKQIGNDRDWPNPGATDRARSRKSMLTIIRI
jgi:hypothetical protein